MRDRLRLVLLTALSGMVFLYGCGSPENAVSSGGEPAVSVSASKEIMPGPEQSSGNRRREKRPRQFLPRKGEPDRFSHGTVSVKQGNLRMRIAYGGFFCT